MTNPNTQINSNSQSAPAGSTSNKTMRGKSKSKTKKRFTAPRKDVCQEVTDRIISLMENGVKEWRAQWANAGGSVLPLRHNGERYRGINLLILWMFQEENGFSSPYWMTYRQAMELGGQVRKGEKSAPSVYYGTAPKKDEPVTSNTGNEEEGFYKFLKSFAVFNADQIDGLPEKYYVVGERREFIGERIPELEAMMQNAGPSIVCSGNRAFYRQATDTVQLPPIEQFPTPEFFYAVAVHELVHSTRIPSRLDRDFGQKRWGDAGYAMEELVAELGAAFVGAEFGFGPDHIEDHATYLASWLKVLKNDKRAIFSAAAKAQEAVDFLMNATQAKESASQ